MKPNYTIDLIIAGIAVVAILGAIVMLALRYSHTWPQLL